MIELRPLAKLSHAELRQVLATRNEPGVRQNMYTNHVIGEDEHFAWIERTIADPASCFLAAMSGGDVVGASVFTKIDRAHKRADWAFYVSRRARGGRIGATLEFISLDYAFNDLELVKVNGEVLAFNLSVLKLHSRFAFREEGIRRRHIMRDGKWIDVHLLGLTRSEWLARRPTLGFARSPRPT